ncbi:hypothetical protein [Sulfitobacter aestuariivivens]
MTGGFNADTFVFSDFGTGFGQDTINDFDANNDLERIDLSDVSAIVNMFDLLSNHTSQINTNVLIDAGDGNSIVLRNVSVDDLDAEDFIF